ncbi:putative lpxtg-domain-containing protein [Eutypa lata UCREL1]|uniref:Putative lpxtg-domain-containing protein n=1 Tax=Eutypa lata (strain UCR-EL1) TaxID=1287681 RepID=M7SJJ8_EUTLA|nr:putative lpxtg-domain-containing protein [Eutypa lata UCREL1]
MTRNNLRYSVDTCVYGFPNDSKRVSSPCDIDTACEPLKKAMETGALDPNRDQYEYCTTDGDVFSSQSLDPCVQCLSTSSDLSYMANFMTALKAGCEQKPKGGSLLGLDGTLFTTTGINITAPPSNQTLTDSDDNSGTMTQGTIVGIAVGAALLLLGGIGLFWVYHRKQKRLYGEPVHSEYDGRSGGSKSITPPLVGGFTSSGGTAADQQKLAAMMQVSEYELRSQQRPASRFYGGGGGGNAEYYDALEKEMYSFQPPNGATVTTTITSNNNNNNYHPNVNHHNYAFNSNIPGSGPHPTLPTHPAYDPRATHSRQGSNHSQAPTPEPPRPARTNTKPDSYALQAYLSAAEDATSLHLPAANTAKARPGSTAPAATTASASQGPRAAAPIDTTDPDTEEIHAAADQRGGADAGGPAPEAELELAGFGRGAEEALGCYGGG